MVWEGSARWDHLGLGLLLAVLVPACSPYNDGGADCGTPTACISYTQETKLHPELQPPDCNFTGGDVYNGRAQYVFNLHPSKHIRVGFRKLKAPINTGDYAPAEIDFKTVPPRESRPLSCLIGEEVGASGVPRLYQYTYRTACASFDTMVDCNPVASNDTLPASESPGMFVLAAAGATGGSPPMPSCADRCDAGSPACKSFPIPYTGGIDRYAIVFATLTDARLFPIKQGDLLQKVGLPFATQCVRQDIHLRGDIMTNQGATCAVSLAKLSGNEVTAVIPAFVELERRVRDGTLSFALTGRSDTPRLSFSTALLDDTWGGEVRAIAATRDTVIATVWTRERKQKCLRFYRSNER